MTSSNRKASNARKRTGWPGQRQQITAVRMTMRDREVVKRRIAGASFRQIAVQLNVSLQTVHASWHRGIARLEDDERSELIQLRHLEVARLDQMQLLAWQRAQRGDLPAILAVCRIVDQRCRLLGLNAPQRLDVSAEITEGRPYQDVSREDIEQRLVALALKDPSARAAIAARLTTRTAATSRLSTAESSTSIEVSVERGRRS